MKIWKIGRETIGMRPCKSLNGLQQGDSVCFEKRGSKHHPDRLVPIGFPKNTKFIISCLLLATLNHFFRVTLRCDKSVPIWLSSMDRDEYAFVTVSAIMNIRYFISDQEGCHQEGETNSNPKTRQNVVQINKCDVMWSCPRNLAILADFGKRRA